MKPIATVLFFLLFAGNLNGQFANTWIFGANAGLNFNTNPPSPLSGGQINVPDNSSTMSDANGSLLFYTDGVKVWNKLHSVMPNGNGLTGHFSAGQSALIVPIPCSSTKYVIFHVTEFSSPGYLSYSVVDMALNNGLGDVVPGQKNISLGTGWTEKLCAYYNTTGNFYWLLTHRWNSAQFVAFQVTANSIAVQSVTTIVGSSHTCGSYSAAHDAMGQLTISPDGTKVVNALTCQDKFEIFQFNQSTGVLSNPIVIYGDGGKAWGTAFSPNSQLIYLNTIFGQKVYQCNISNYSQSAVAASLYTVASVTSSGYNFGYMELGPNGKVYISRPNTGVMSVVSNPNASGAACNFALSGQSLGSNMSTHGTSRIAYNISQSTGGILSSAGNSICAGTSVMLTAPAASSYSWSTGATFQNIYVTPTVTTTYSVTSTGGSCELQSTITITVNPAPQVLVAAQASICAGSSATLSASGANTYTWSNGSQGPVLTITPAITQVYSVTGGNSSGCTATAQATVQVNPIPNVGISGPGVVCFGMSAVLTATGAGSYTWNPGGTSPSLTVTPLAAQSYFVTGNLGGCTATAGIFVNVSECLGLTKGEGGTLSIFPNPSPGVFTIKGYPALKPALKVKSLNGSEVAFKITDAPGGELLLDLSGIPPGVYLLVDDSAGPAVHHRLIVEP